MNEEAVERLFLQEPSGQLPAESLYDKRWAVAVLDRAMSRLGVDYAAAGKREIFEQLKPLLLSEGSAEVYRELAGLRLPRIDGHRVTLKS